MKELITKFINNAFLVSVIGLLGIALIFQEPLSQRILTAGCTDINLHHVQFKLCDPKSVEKIEIEKLEVEKNFKALNEEYINLENLNSSLEAELKKCNSTSTQAETLIARSNIIRRDYSHLRLQLDTYLPPQVSAASRSTR